MSKSHTLRIRCDAQLKADLDALAARENRTMSNLALHVLTQYTQAHAAAPEPMRETAPPYGQPAGAPVNSSTPATSAAAEAASRLLAAAAASLAQSHGAGEPSAPALPPAKAGRGHRGGRS